jgi:hypothetical protein
MFKSIRWKKALSLAAAAGIIGLSAYGIFHTASAFSDIRQSQANNDIIADTLADKDNPSPGGPFCNPLGCAACGGCVSLEYEQNIQSLPVSAVQIEQL